MQTGRLLFTLRKYAAQAAVFLYHTAMQAVYGIGRRPFWRPRRKNGFARYAVVTAVYNAEGYLEEYFRSLTTQLLDFTAHIRLIMVNDGSTDGSAAIIRAWQARYPENIILIEQENRGQGAARNAGLALVTEPWVTFIDADDYVDAAYFLRVDDFLRGRSLRGDEPAVKLMCSNYIYYFENGRGYRNTHPLRFRFAGKKERVVASDSAQAIQLSGGSSFIRMADLGAHRFHEKRWPKFEDSDFIIRYLHDGRPGTVAYLSRARYYYRKRAAGSSSLDTAQYKKSAYLDLFRECHLGLVTHFMQTRGQVPAAVQWCLLYDIMVCVRLVLGGFAIDSVLTPQEQDECFELLREVFTAIDDDVILQSGRGIKQYDHIMKTGVMGCFKDKDMPDRVVYVRPSPQGGRLLVYGSRGDEPLTLHKGGQSFTPPLAQAERLFFLNRLFVIKSTYLSERDAPADNCRATVGGKAATVVLG